MKTLALLLLFLCVPAQATKHRGLWFWQDSGNPWGSEAIVGSLGLENSTIAFFTSHWIKRLYGSYGNRPVSEPAVIAAWNAKLQAAGIESQVLFAQHNWIFPADRPTLLTHITNRVINFNSAPGRTAAQKFDAIHLDLEPHALAEWSGLTSAQKRSYLLDLRDTFVDVRAHLTAAGLPNFPVYADLPVWFDNFPPDPSGIGWLSAVDRDQWFNDIAVPLTGVSLMAFERETFSLINNGVTWERTNITGAVVRVGIQPKIPETWADVPAFNNMMETLETAYGTGGAVDIENYRRWREELAAQPLVPVAAAFKPLMPAGTGEIEFETEPGWTYVILSSLNLCNWQEIARHRAASTAVFGQRLDTRAPRGFWQVIRFQENQ